MFPLLVFVKPDVAPGAGAGVWWGPQTRRSEAAGGRGEGSSGRPGGADNPSADGTPCSWSGVLRGCGCAVSILKGAAEAAGRAGALGFHQLLDSPARSVNRELKYF